MTLRIGGKVEHLRCLQDTIGVHSQGGGKRLKHNRGSSIIRSSRRRVLFQHLRRRHQLKVQSKRKTRRSGGAQNKSRLHLLRRDHQRLHRFLLRPQLLLPLLLRHLLLPHKAGTLAQVLVMVGGVEVRLFPIILLTTISRTSRRLHKHKRSRRRKKMEAPLLRLTWQPLPCRLAMCPIH